MRHHSGGALISALFITAIAAMLATALAVSQRFLIHEETLSLRADQLYLQLQGEQAQASQAIKSYLMQWSGAQSSAQFIPLKNTLSEVSVDGVAYSGVIDQPQGKYNLNNLIYSVNQSGFAALLQAVIPTISKDTAFNIAKSITAWETTGSQDAYYLSLNPAYRSSKSEMVNVSELRLIAGVTPEIYAAISPFVSALPIPKSVSMPTASKTQPITSTFVGMPVDINAASAFALLAVNPSLTMAQAQALVICRKRYGGFSDLSQFESTCVKPNGINGIVGVVTQSQYFTIKTQAERADQVVSLKSLMVTQVEKNNKLQLVTVWQAFE